MLKERKNAKVISIINIRMQAQSIPREMNIENLNKQHKNESENLRN